jgi:dCTP deaminase
MILSDREIKAALERDVVSLNPFPADRAWSSTAVDLRLADELVVWNNPSGAGAQVTIAPAHANFDFQGLLQNFSTRATIPPAGYLFRSHSFLLGWTIEKLKLPFRSRLAARVEGKSSLARLGIGVHVTAPTIHAGFGDKPGDPTYAGSPLQLEIWNVGPLDILLEAGMPICQLIFEWVDGTPEKGYEGRFSIQGPTAAP